VEVDKENTTIYNQSGDTIKLYLFGEPHEISENNKITAQNV
jgi:hypothetical protein